MYIFLDGLNVYNQVKMEIKDRDKIAFITEWGELVATMVMFELKNTPMIFQRMVQEILYDYLTNFMKVIVNYLNGARDKAKHFFHLILCLEVERHELEDQPHQICFCSQSKSSIGLHCVKIGNIELIEMKSKLLRE